MSRIEQLISDIESYIDNCKFQPLSNTKIIVNKEQLEDMLAELRLKTPEEVKKYQKILNNKDAKREYHKRLEHIFELIKYVYYNNNRVIGYRAMRIFIKRYGYELSNTTMHKYMNKELNLCAVIMHSKLGYKTGKKKTTLK